MLSDLDYLKQMIALSASMVAVTRQFIIDNPDSDLEDFAEEQLEDTAGDLALMQLWLEQGGDEPAKGAAVASTKRTAAKKPGLVYLDNNAAK